MASFHSSQAICGVGESGFYRLYRSLPTRGDGLAATMTVDKFLSTYIRFGELFQGNKTVN